jgi:type IV pilus assembly protein PilA
MREERRRGGFTLVELMIVVALIGVLAAIAIPNFLGYLARSRRSEAYANLASVARAQKSFQATRGVFHDSVLPYPDDAPYGGLGSHRMIWDADSEDAFSELGWIPEGQVHYAYHTNTTNNCSCELCFTASAYGDVDDNGQVSAVMYVEPQRDGDGAIAGKCRSGMGGDMDFGPPTRLNTSKELYNEVAIQRITDEY